MAVFLLKEEIWTQTQICTEGRQCEESHGTMEAETAGTQLQAWGTEKANLHQRLGETQATMLPRLRGCQHGRVRLLPCGTEDMAAG